LACDSVFFKLAYFGTVPSSHQDIHRVLHFRVIAKL
jgi:hypothetical protein